MALIKCKECGREISDKARACPGCGAPLSLTIPPPLPPPTPKTMTKASLSTGQQLAFVAMVLIVLFGFFSCVGNQGDSEAINSTPQAAQPQASAKDYSHLSKKELDKVLSECLVEQIKYGDYTSKDGGTSALSLLGQCPNEWHAWHDSCMTRGGKDGDCMLKLGVLSQAAIKFSGK